MLAEQPQNPTLDQDCQLAEAPADSLTLQEYLVGLELRGAAITEVTHIVNKWHAGSLTLPLKHHGFILRASDGDYLRLHFVRCGIQWRHCPEQPKLPACTCYSKTHHVNVHPRVVLDYCDDTKPWAWPQNDCKKWAQGFMLAMGVCDAPGSLEEVPQHAMKTRLKKSPSE